MNYAEICTALREAQTELEKIPCTIKELEQRIENLQRRQAKDLPEQIASLEARKRDIEKRERKEQLSDKVKAQRAKLRELERQLRGA